MLGFSPNSAQTAASLFNSSAVAFFWNSLFFIASSILLLDKKSKSYLNTKRAAINRCLRSITALTLFLIFNYLYRITGHCFVFFPAFLRSRAKTISPVRSKYPISFFQLMPHLQCCKPINCCFIFLPQFGHTFLLMPFFLVFGLSASSAFFSFFSFFF